MRPGRGSGRARGPTALGDLLGGVLRNAGATRRAAVRRLGRLWLEVMDAEVASRTRIVSFKEQVLTVEVGAAPLLSELALYRREEIQATLNARWDGAPIREIRFRGGSVGGDDTSGNCSRRAQPLE